MTRPHAAYELKAPATMKSKQGLWRKKKYQLTCGTCGKHSKWCNSPFATAKWVSHHMQESFHCVEVHERPTDEWLANRLRGSHDAEDGEFDRYYDEP